MHASARTFDFTETDDAAILMLWNLKMDTHEIATRQGRSEYQVANQLAALRDQGRA